MIEKEYFFRDNPILNQQDYIIKTIEDPNLEQYFHYYSPEFLENLVNRIFDHINKIIQKDTKFALIPIHNRKIAFNFFDSSRVPSLEGLSMKVFQSYEHLTKNPELTDPPNLLEAYLISIKKDINNILSNRSGEKGHTIWMVNEVQKWFLKVENDLKNIFENDSIELSFSKDGNEVLINLRNRNVNYSFEQLSSGFKAIFYIYSSLLMRAEREKISPEELSGVTIIDEIDVHLHISLQKKILPFLIKSFPKTQFIVSTHSPFVITSTNNDTVVYDISSGEFFDDDLSLYSHESIIKELFHINPESNDTLYISKLIVEFIEQDMHRDNLMEIKNTLERIEMDLPKLSIESQLQYIVAKNKLEKITQEGSK
ncbi:AAA family ATPase [Acinetobacter wanghuae]|uniref:AAA family ATPase n=1 Tax=Acinetobacter wanghuae TaxID=2662362 RepID=UPI00148F0B5F|nr:AAA family ATPase [Acinetobacter wanghuae]